MIRPATKIGLELLAGLVAVALVLAGVAAWRLQQGPLAIDFLTSFVEETVNEQIDGFTVDIGSMAMVWTGDGNAAELKALDVSLAGSDGRIVARVPAVAIDFRAGAALAGRLVPQYLSFDGLSLTLVRQMDGGLRLGLADALAGESAVDTGADQPIAAADDDPAVALILDAVTAREAGAAAGLHLEGINVRGANITVFDARSRTRWRAPDVDLEFRNTPQGMAGTVRAQVISPASKWQVAGTLDTSADGERVILATDVTDITLSELSQALPALEPLAMVDAAVNGRLTTELDRGDLRIMSLAFDLTSERGALRLPLDEPEPFVPPAPLGYDGQPIDRDAPPPVTRPKQWTYALDMARLVGRATWPEGHLVLDELRLAGPEIGISIAAAGSLKTTPDGDIQRVDVEIDSGPAFLTVPNVTEGIARVDGASVSVSFEPATGHLAVRSATVTLGEGFLTLSGAVEGLGVGAPISARLDGNIETVSFGDLLNIWPPRVAYGARQWAAENILGGIIDRASVRLDAAPGDLAVMPLPDDAVRIDLEYENLELRYLGQLPPIERARGTLALTGNTFTAAIDEGFVAPPQGGLVRLSGGSLFTRDFHIRGNDGVIGVDVAGSAAAILAVIDAEPFGFASAFGLRPMDVGGSASLRLEVVLPLRKRMTVDDVDARVSGRVERFSLPEGEEGVSLSNGSLAVEVTTKRLVSRGTVDLAGFPASVVWTEQFDADPRSTFDIAATLDRAALEALGVDPGADIMEGQVPITAHLRGNGADIVSGSLTADLTPVTFVAPLNIWRKPAGEPARMTADFAIDDEGGAVVAPFSIDGLVAGEASQIDGSIRLDSRRRLMQADFPVLRVGDRVDLSARVSRPDDGTGLEVDVTGSRFDARGMRDALFERRDRVDDGETGDAGGTFALHARIDSVTAYGGEVLQDADVYLESVDGTTRKLRTTARFADGAAVSVEVTPGSYGERRVTARSEDAGALLRALDIYANVQGGVLAFDGMSDGRGADAPLRGTLEGSGFRALEAPILAKVLSLASLTGISDQLRNEGILFTRLDVPLRISESQIGIEDAILSGPALGATIQGHIDRRRDIVDLGGTIVPAYTLNSFLGNIPLLGQIVVGRKGEGIFGITYALSGPTESPEVLVNPLAVLAPGFLRRIFEIGGGPAGAIAEGPFDEVPAGIPPPAPGDGG